MAKSSKAVFSATEKKELISAIVGAQSYEERYQIIQSVSDKAAKDAVFAEVPVTVDKGYKEEVSTVLPMPTIKGISIASSFDIYLSKIEGNIDKKKKANFAGYCALHNESGRLIICNTLKDADSAKLYASLSSQLINFNKPLDQITARCTRDKKFKQLLYFVFKDLPDICNSITPDK
jgi:hypothetical protein